MAGRDLADADAQTTPEGEAEQTATILVKAGIQNFHVNHGNSGFGLFQASRTSKQSQEHSKRRDLPEAAAV